MAKRANEVSNRAAMGLLLRDPALRNAVDRASMLVEIGHSVFSMRAAAGMSRTELAKAAGATRAQVASVESGRSQRLPGLALLARLAAATGARVQVSLVPSGTGPAVKIKR